MFRTLAKTFQLRIAYSITPELDGTFDSYLSVRLAPPSPSAASSAGDGNECRRTKDAFGATLMFDDLSITGSSAEGIRVDTCSGHIKGEHFYQYLGLIRCSTSKQEPPPRVCMYVCMYQTQLVARCKRRGTYDHHICAENHVRLFLERVSQVD